MIKITELKLVQVTGYKNPRYFIFNVRDEELRLTSDNILNLGTINRKLLNLVGDFMNIKTQDWKDEVAAVLEDYHAKDKKN